MPIFVFLALFQISHETSLPRYFDRVFKNWRSRSRTPFWHFGNSLPPPRATTTTKISFLAPRVDLCMWSSRRKKTEHIFETNLWNPVNLIKMYLPGGNWLEVSPRGDISSIRQRIVCGFEGSWAGESSRRWAHFPIVWLKIETYTLLSMRRGSFYPNLVGSQFSWA